MITILDIKNFVKAETGITRKQMSSVKRGKEIACARHIAMYLCRKFTNASYPEIGRAFNRDHASVIHAVKKMEKHLMLNNNAIIDKFRIITLDNVVLI